MTGLALKDILRAHRFTISDVADKLELTNQNLFNMLSKDDIRTGLVERISAATGIPLAELYGIAAAEGGDAAALRAQVADLQATVASQQRTIAELSAAVSRLVK